MSSWPPSRRPLRAIAALLGLILGSSAVEAIPFFSFDPRSMGMGSVGVAVASPGIAPFYNPALLAASRDDDDLSVQLPIIGARVYDPDEFVDNLNHFIDEDYIGRVEDAFDELNYDGQTRAEARKAADEILALSSGLQVLSGRRIQVELAGATVIGIPSRKYGMALSISGWTAGAGYMRYKDAALVQNYMDVLYTYADSQGSIADTLTMYESLGDMNNDDEIDDPTTMMESEIAFEGLVVSEVGLSFAREVTLFNHRMSVGIQPKAVTAIVFDYHESIKSGANDDLPEWSDVNIMYQNFNLDVGMAKDYANGWRTGVVMRNIFKQDYTAPNGTRVSIEPQVRLGVSKMSTWYLLAMDMDLTVNDSVAYEEETRFIAFGAELYYMRWGALRVGYRVNTFDTSRNVSSIGFDIGTAIDVAFAYSKVEKGAALQIGFSY